MEENEITIKLKNGQEIKGKLIAQALCVLILKVDNHYFLVNKFKIEDEDGRL